MARSLDDVNRRQSNALAYFSGVLEETLNTADSEKNSMDEDTVESIIDKFNRSLEENDVESRIIQIEK
jgi:hypothetical protein